MDLQKLKRDEKLLEQEERRIEKERKRIVKRYDMIKKKNELRKEKLRKMREKEEKMKDEPKKIYCGVKEPAPSGYIYGSLEECKEKDQIRRYGRYKADTRIIERKLKKDPVVTRKNLIIQISGNRGALKRLKEDIQSEKTKKRLGKEYDQQLLLELSEEAKRISAEQKKTLEKLKKLEELKKIELSYYGGKVPVKLLQELFKNEKLEDIDNYKIDKQLSTEWVRVFHDPKNNHTIVVHRGSKDLYDAWVDLQLGLGYKGNKRFKESKRIQEEAEKKYGTSNMSVVGSSLGGTLAEDFGKGASEIITSGKPVTPLDLIVGKKPHKSQHDVRTKTDIISFLKPFQKHDNDIVVKSIDPMDLLKSHLGTHTMEAVMKKHGDDFEIGEDDIGIIEKKDGGSIPNFKKMKIHELKEYIKVNRRAKKLKAKDYALTGKKKSDLVKFAMEIYTCV